MQNELYQPNEYVVIRTPINSTEEFCHLFSNAKLTKQRIQNLKEDSCFRELLKTASHDLAQYFLDENAACTDKLLHSGIKYAIRSSSRCTPYGLCAGVSLAKLGEHTDILLGNKNSFVKFSRPDMEWLFSIIHKIISDKNILPSLKVCSNPYIYEKGSRLINPWHVDLAGVGSKETQISIRNSPLVQHVLSLSKSYILYDDLQHIILSESSTANESKVTSFLNNLIDSEYLLVNLYPNLVNNNPLEHVINILQHIPTAKHWYEQLTEIKSLLNQYSSSSVGNSEAILNELFNKMQLLSPKKDYIQVDLKKPLAGSTLCNKVSNEAQKLITLLLSLSAKQETLPQRDTFKNQFIERYGYDVAVSILNVFDNDMGIGAPSGYAFPRSKQQISFSGTGETPLGKFLFYKVQYALRNNLSEISLSDDELKEFKSDIDITAAPNSVELCFQIISDSVHDLDDGLFYLMPTGFIGSGESGKSFGRFRYMFNDELSSRTQISETDKSDALIDVELSEYPMHKRNCNVMLCSSSYKYQLSLDIPSDIDNSIDIKDIYIGVDSTTNSFYLKSSKLNKRLHIDKSNLFNCMLGSNIFRFLCEINEIPFLPISRTYGIFQSLPGTFIPRITYNRIILSPAKWRIPSLIIKQGTEDFNRFKDAWGIPDIVYMVQGDHKLLLNLKNPYHIQLLIELNSKKADDVVLTEAIGYNDSSWLNDVNGSPFANEVVLSFLKKHESKNDNVSEPKALQLKNTPKDICHSLYDNNSFLLPGANKWVYIKIYCTRDSADALISNEMYDFCKFLCDSKLIDRYFFIRYLDPDFHIRLRLKLLQSLDTILPYLSKWQNEIKKTYFVSKIQIDTYVRETWRYGGLKVIDLAEEVFFRDSEVIIQAIQGNRFCSLDNDNDVLFGILNVLSIAQSFGLNRMDLEMWLSQSIPSSSYRDVFRAQRKEILDAIALFYSHKKPIGNVELSRRHHVIALYKQALDTADVENTLTASKASILSSLIHMSLNRMRGNNHWEQKVRSLCRNGLYAYNQRIAHHVKRGN